MTYSTCGRHVPCLMLVGLLATAGCPWDGEKKHVEPPRWDSAIPGRPQIAAAPGTVNVGTVDVGTTSTALPVAITNVGSAPAALTITPSPAGLIAASGCAGTLPAGQSCVLLITATPSGGGPIAGSVAVMAAGGNTLIIVVTGPSAGIPESLTISPTAVDLGDVAIGVTVSATVTLWALRPFTGLTFGVRGADLELAPATDCQATMAANTSCGIVVDFTSATPGAATGNAIYVSQGGMTKSVPVSANVLGPASLVAEPRALALTAIPGAPGTAGIIRVGNGGGQATGPIAFVIVPPAASFLILTNACGSGPLRGGDECALTVAYSPTAMASPVETASLVVSDLGPGASSATVALTGAPNVPGSFVIGGGPDLGTASVAKPGAEVTFTVTALAATGVLGRFEVGDPNVLITSNTCKGKSLKTGESCAVGLTLSPLATGTPGGISTLLTIASDGDAPQYLAVTGAILAV